MISSYHFRDAPEYALATGRGRGTCVLIVPALFDEGNKLRHFSVELMRALDEGGADSILPDLPGSNESGASLTGQSIASWQAAMRAAAEQLRASHVLTIRGGCLLSPENLPALHYAPVAGGNLLRAMLRAQVLSEREAGRTVSRDELLARGKAEGLQIAGYDLSPAMIASLENAQPGADANAIGQSEIGGGGLWLRAEPEHDPQQARALARIVLERLA